MPTARSHLPTPSCPGRELARESSHASTHGLPRALQVQLRLARTLRATARQLHAHLRAKSKAGAGWATDAIADHRAVIPPMLRFLHGLMLDYHAAFHGDVDVSLGVLKEVCAAS